MERFDNVRKRTRNDAAKPWKNRASTYPNSAHGSDQPVHNSSDERQEFRWAVQAGGMPANERNQLRWRHWHGRGFTVKLNDLGINKATNGMVRAHVIRLVPPCRPEEVSKRHFHDVDFQMVYVLKGWMKTEFAGQGAMVMEAGSCWIQPPRIEHLVLDYSDDCEVLEIILPADFETVELE